MKHSEGLIYIFSSFFDLTERLLGLARDEPQLSPFLLCCPADFLKRNKANQGVARTDIKVDVRQWFQVFYVIHLSHQFEKEPEFADFYGLFHDIHAVEVVDNNRLQDE